MEHIRVWVTLKFSKCFKITHTPSLNLRDHVPNISATMVYGMDVWVKRMGEMYGRNVWVKRMGETYG